MSARQLRARLDRLPQPPTEVIGEDRNRDRKRREELRGRELSPAGLTEREKAEYTKLEALFHEEDRLRTRSFGLAMKQFNAEVRGGDPLSDEEMRDVAELTKLGPLNPELAKEFEPIRQIFRKLAKQEGP
jgi:hypothetical protein